MRVDWREVRHFLIQRATIRGKESDEQEIKRYLRDLSAFLLLHHTEKEILTALRKIS